MMTVSGMNRWIMCTYAGRPGREVGGGQALYIAARNSDPTKLPPVNDCMHTCTDMNLMLMLFLLGAGAAIVGAHSYRDTSDIVFMVVGSW
jgi:hypothetical protein